MKADFTLTRLSTCTRCRGTGRAWAFRRWLPRRVHCDRCNGQGVVMMQYRYPPLQLSKDSRPRI